MRADNGNRKIVRAGVSDGPTAGIELRTWLNPQLEPRHKRGSLMSSCARDRHPKGGDATGGSGRSQEYPSWVKPKSGSGRGRMRQEYGSF